MQWFTPVEVPVSPFQIKMEHKILTLGSCFAEQIGQKFVQNKFFVNVNPFGTTYNPLSIFEQLETVLGQGPDATFLAERNGVWVHFGYHSRFAERGSGQAVIDKIKQALTAKELQETQVVIFTLGTAWVYERAGRVVANCHRFPQNEFTKRLLEVEEIVEAFSRLYDKALSGKTVLFTLSPVRHQRDTFSLNSVGKAVLRLAIHKICQRWPVGYFPAYEIQLDELRDYRFYADDLLHPSEQAIEHIWQTFSQAYFSDADRRKLSKLAAIRRGLAHRPHELGPAYAVFLSQLTDEIKALGTEIDLTQELLEVEQRKAVLNFG